MAAWAAQAMDLLWRNALGAIPLALIVVMVCRWLPCRPTTRHMLWFLVLCWFVLPTFLPDAPRAEFVVASLSAGAESEPDESATEDLAVFLPGSATLGATDPLVAPIGRNRRPSRTATPHGFAQRDDGRNPLRLARKENPYLLTERTPLRTGSFKPKSLAPAAATGGRLFGLNSTHSIQQNTSQRLAKYPHQRGLRHSTTSSSVAGKSPTDESRAIPQGFNRVARIPNHLSDAAKDVESVPIAVPTARAYEGASEVQEPKDAVAAKSNKPSDWQLFAAGVGAVRDAIRSLPTFPWRIWLVGAVLLALGQVIKTLHFRRRMDCGSAAPPSVQQMVEDIAKGIGLRRIPDVVMIRDRVSPMVWCGRRARLVLPRGLWSQLDDPSRRAVVCHELAHLRRGDHWVSWVQIVVDTLYWWNPLAWWVRNRMQMEAETCCDAWVTWILPRGRRAYAEALVKTKAYLSEDHLAVPPVGIGMASGRAKRFARRLTMVMTESQRPRLTASGIGLVLLLATTGWVASPAWSCPPKDTGGQRAAVATGVAWAPCADCKPCKSCKSVVAIGKCKDCKSCKDCRGKGIGKGCGKCKSCDSCASRAKSSKCGKCRLVRDGRSSGRRGPCSDCAKGLVIGSRGRSAGCADCKPCKSCKRTGRRGVVSSGKLFKPNKSFVFAPSPSIEARPQLYATNKSWPRFSTRMAPRVVRVAGDDPQMQQRLRRLEEKLERLADELGDLMDSAVDGDGDRVDRKKKEKKGRKARHAPRVPRVGRAPRVPRAPRAERAPRPPRPASPPRPDAEDDDGNIVRFYEIPDGRREALTELMVRSDVPVLVAPKPNGIEFHGSHRQHKIFGAFVDMIAPGSDSQSRAHDHPDSHAVLHTFRQQHFAEALARAKEIRHGAELRTREAKEAVKRIHKHMKHEAKTRKDAVEKAKRRIERRVRSSRDRRSSRDVWREESIALRILAERFAIEANAMQDEVRLAQIETRPVFEQAERLMQQAASLQDDELIAQFESAAELIEAQASAIEDEVSYLEDEADLFRDQVENVMEQAEAMFERAEELQRELEEEREEAEADEEDDEDSEPVRADFSDPGVIVQALAAFVAGSQVVPVSQPATGPTVPFAAPALATDVAELAKIPVAQSVAPVPTE